MLWRTWQSLQAKRRLLAPLWTFEPGQFFADALQYPELECALREGPELRPYEGLAELWDTHCAPRLPDYPSFLASLAERRGIGLRSVLDLACGAGTLSARLSRVIPGVVGLDASEAMLEQARRRPDLHRSVEFVRGDFRDFELGRQFDAMTCASNSLNYVADLRELAGVFSAVAKHLKPGGLFVFDTITELGMRQLSGLFFHAEVNGKRFALRFAYDVAGRKETSIAILASGIETHRRIPLNAADVELAARLSGLRVEDSFCSALIPGRWQAGNMSFFVLTKQLG